MTLAKKRVTIKDVAAEAGVSYQTVSRVINNSDNVKPKTRASVQRAIESLNFRPSLAARSLPRNRSFIIGLIIPYEAEYLFRDPNLLAQISGIDAEANAHDYNLLLSTAGDSNSGPEAFRRLLQNQVADGVLVIETAASQEGSRLLARENYPYVTLGYDPDNPDGYSVHCDDRTGVQAATRHLLEKGHRRIGVINGPSIGAVASMERRLLGHLQALHEAGLSFDERLMVYGDYTRPSGQAAAQALLALPDPPTAILAFNDRMAMGAIRFLHGVGLAVPGDVAVVGFDDISTAADFSPALTTVCLPAKKIGHVAAQLLLKLIAGEPVEQKEVVIPTQLVVRQSS